VSSAIYQWAEHTMNALPQPYQHEKKDVESVWKFLGDYVEE
jgi:hypothetical protein